MVVEDDPAIREMLVRSLGLDYNVFEASDGKLKTEPQQLRSIPIIFLTGRDSPKDVVQGINVGARHYLTKPFKIQELLAKVAKTLGIKK
jgi:DNA-binding response OmpR family regulator